MPHNYQPFRIHPKRSSWVSQIASIAVTIVITLVAALMLNQFVFQSFFVDGESMSPTLHTSDRLIVSRIERTVAKVQGKQYIPARGQIVVINGDVSPLTASRAPELIKRVVGLPGDTIDIADGKITITSQGKTFDFNSTFGLNLEATYSADPLRTVVPSDSVFVVGDNRAQGGSFDSRSFGPVKTSFIDGRLLMRIMPFDHIRVF